MSTPPYHPNYRPLPPGLFGWCCLVVAWVLALVSIVSSELAGTWDTCPYPTGAAPGFVRAVLTGFGAVVAFLLGEVVLLWPGKAAIRRRALAAGVLTAGVVIAANWLLATHPEARCYPPP